MTMRKKTVQTCKNMLKKSIEGKIDIELLMLEYRCTPIVNVNATHCELLNSRLLKTKLLITKQNLKP